MTDLESLETKLNNLRLKWKGKPIPETDNDPDWLTFQRDKTEAEALKAEIAELKPVEVTCYQCKEKKSITACWPYCSPECKEKWANEHYGKPKAQKTIEEIQRRLMEMSKGKRADQPIEDSDEMYKIGTASFVANKSSTNFLL